MEWIEYCKSFANKLCEIFKKRTNRILNLSNPKTLSEKIQWLKIYDCTFLKTFCADKIAIHNYCKSKLNEDICIPILGIYDKIEEIDFSKLPNKFVIKYNFGSTYNVIVKDKSKLNLNEIKKKFEFWKNDNYSFKSIELQYLNIPKKIFIEEYKENKGHSDLTDYKIFCFNGQPKFVQLIADRNSNKITNHYDVNWNYCDLWERNDIKSDKNVIIEKPKTFNQMLLYAEKLSKDFKFVRIDFYEIEDKTYLGEMTFTPNAGFYNFKNENADFILGEMLNL